MAQPPSTPTANADVDRPAEDVRGQREDVRGLATPDAVVLADAADTFAMLASPQRLHLLWLLSQEECDVSTLAGTLGVSAPLVSQHLAKMRWAGLVSAHRDGKRQVYTVDDPHVVTLVAQAIDHHEDLRARA